MLMTFSSKSELIPPGTVVDVAESSKSGFGLAFQETEVLYDQYSDIQRITWLKTKSHGVVLLLDGQLMITQRDRHYYHEALVTVAAERTLQLNKALVIGGGDLDTSRELLCYKGLKVTLVDIDRQVTESALKFFDSERNNFERLKIFHSDTNRWVNKRRKEGKKKFDLILVDSSKPWASSNKSHFSQEFYQKISRLLNRGGLIAVQIGSLHFDEKRNKKEIVKLRKGFDFADPYPALCPSHPGGSWIFALCGNNHAGQYSSRWHYHPKGRSYNDLRAVVKNSAELLIAGQSLEL